MSILPHLIGGYVKLTLFPLTSNALMFYSLPPCCQHWLGTGDSCRTWVLKSDPQGQNLALLMGFCINITHSENNWEPQRAGHWTSTPSGMICVLVSAWLCTEVRARLFARRSTSSLCGRVTVRMRPLSRDDQGDDQYRSPMCVAATLCPYVRRGGVRSWWGRAWGVGMHARHRPHPPPMPSFSVFFMIRDKIMSLSSTPENISLGCIIAV